MIEQKQEHRGGPRPGSGRKPKAAEDRRVQLAISCTAKQKAAIVKTAADCGKTTSDFILWRCGEEADGNVKNGFSEWLKKNIPEKGLSEDITYVRQFLIDIWRNGRNNGYNDGFRDGFACGEDNARKKK